MPFEIEPIVGDKRYRRVPAGFTEHAATEQAHQLLESAPEIDEIVVYDDKGAYLGRIDRQTDTTEDA